MRILTTIALLAILGTGCATTARLEAQMQDRIGQNINDVIDEKGPPSQAIPRPDGKIIYTWTYRRPASASVYRWSAYDNEVEISQIYCDISYTTEKTGEIISWYHRGNGCRAR